VYRPASTSRTTWTAPLSGLSLRAAWSLVTLPGVSPAPALQVRGGITWFRAPGPARHGGLLALRTCGIRESMSVSCTLELRVLLILRRISRSLRPTIDLPFTVHTCTFCERVQSTRLRLVAGVQRDPTAQYSTIQYNTIQYNTIQYNTIQYNTIHTLDDCLAVRDAMLGCR
jgi:hypothetical protein